ncbi:MAG: PAS domain-containing protein [Anaerolinea sp.]|nr:PAS domain-containing protein [Anaerolinea sp.]
MFQFNPLALHLVPALIILIGAARIVWMRSVSVPSRYYVYFTAAVCVYLFGYIVELSLTELPLILWVVQLEHTAVSVIAPAWAAFMLAYVHREHWLKLPLVRILLIGIPAVYLIVSWMGEWHNLYYTRIGLAEINGLIYFDRTYGIGFYITVSALMGLLLVSQAISLFIAMRSPNLFARQIVPLQIVSVIVWSGGLLTVFHDTLNLVPYLDLSAISLAFACLPLGWSVLRENLFQMLPAAHRWLVHEMPDAIIIIDGAGWIVEINRAAISLFEIQPEQARGQQLQTVAPKIATLVDLNATTPSPMIEYKTLLSDCSSADFEFRQVPISAPTGRMFGFALVLRNTTERVHNREEALRLALEREKVRITREMIGGIAHDFRTPLSEINLKAYLLKIAPDPDRRQQHLEEVYERVRYIDTLIADMQLLIALDMENECADCAPLAAGTLLNDMATYLQSRAQANEQIVTVDCQPGDTIITVNASRMQRALRSILDNAVKFTPPHGWISVRCAVVGDRLHITIEDSGVGIDEEDLPHIFERFYKPSARSTAGAGLGLAISKAIIEQHGGSISAESIPGKGSRFRIDLPSS